MDFISLKKKLKTFLNNYWPILVIFLAVCVFFYPVFLKGLVPIPGDFIVGTYFPWLDYKWGTIAGVPVKNPITSDVASVIYPIKSLVVDIYKSGKIPLWNPYMFAGYPLLGNFQAGIFSPTMLVYLFLDKVNGWTAQIILQPVISAIFFYFLLRHFGIKKNPSLFGGLAYAFSGFSMIWMEWNAHALVAAMIPAVLLFTDKFILDRKIKWGLLLSVSLSIEIFAGYPQLIVYTLFALSVLIFFRYYCLTKSALLKIVLFIVLGFGIAAIQIVPGTELFGQSQRGAEVLAKDITFLPYQNLIGFLAPDFYGNHATGNFWGVGNYTNNVGYTGIIVFTLALLAVFNKWSKREVKYLTLLFVLSLLLSLENPITDFISSSKLLGFSALSNTRSLILANFALAGLFSFGLDTISSDNKKFKIIYSFLPVIILSVSITVIFLWLKSGYLDQSQIIHFEIALKNLILPFIFSLLAIFLIILAGSPKLLSVSMITILLGLFAILELFRFGWKYTPFSPKNLIFPETPVLSYLENSQKPNRFNPDRIIPMNFWVPYKLESISGYDAAYPAAISKYIAVLNSGKINVTSEGRQANLETTQSPLLDIANTEYYLGIKNKIPEKKDNSVKVFEDMSVEIYKNINALPRALFVNKWVITDGDNALLSLFGKDFSTGKKIVLADNFSGFESDPNAKGEAKYEQISTDEFKITVDSTGPGFVFVSNTYYPGWKAVIDGNPEKIYKADYAFMAVPVNAGPHDINFTYDPDSLRTGMGMTVFSLLTIFITCCIL